MNMVIDEKNYESAIPVILMLIATPGKFDLDTWLNKPNFTFLSSEYRPKTQHGAA